VCLLQQVKFKVAADYYCHFSTFSAIPSFFFSVNSLNLVHYFNDSVDKGSKF
jgi:hypothetical protein